MMHLVFLSLCLIAISCAYTVDFQLGIQLVYTGDENTITGGVLTVPTINDIVLTFENVEGTFSGGLYVVDGDMVNDTVLYDGEISVEFLSGANVSLFGPAGAADGVVSGSASVAGVEVEGVSLLLGGESLDDYVFIISDDSVAVGLDLFLEDVPGGLIIKDLNLQIGVNVSYCFGISLDIEDIDFENGGEVFQIVAKYIDLDILEICGKYDSVNPNSGQIAAIAIGDLTLRNVTYNVVVDGLQFIGMLEISHFAFATPLLLDSEGTFGSENVLVHAQQNSSIQVILKELDQLGVESTTLSGVSVDVEGDGEENISASLNANLQWRSICFDITLKYPDQGSAQLCNDEPILMSDIAEGLPELSLDGVTLDFDGNIPKLNFTIDFAENPLIAQLADIIGIDLSFDISAALEDGVFNEDDLFIPLSSFTADTIFEDIVDADCDMDINADPPVLDCLLGVLLPTFEDALQVPFTGILDGEDLVLVSSPTENQIIESSWLDGASLEFADIESELSWTGESFEGTLAASIRNEVFGTTFCVQFSSTLPTNSADDVNYISAGCEETDGAQTQVFALVSVLLCLLF